MFLRTIQFWLIHEWVYKTEYNNLTNWSSNEEIGQEMSFQSNQRGQFEFGQFDTIKNSEFQRSNEISFHSVNGDGNVKSIEFQWQFCFQIILLPIIQMNILFESFNFLQPTTLTSKIFTLTQTDIDDCGEEAIAMFNVCDGYEHDFDIRADPNHWPM